MTHQIVVCYGTPADSAAFDEYYRTVHIPLAAEVPGLSGFTWGKCASLDSAEPPYYAVAHLRFDTEQHLRRALASDEMRAAGRDVRNFATGGVTMYTEHPETVTR
ncbi:EthD family reductase [Rhodococcus chondri]|uniref:EthD family reductase n=1 Tax=Rhodococcus chondri TaxID=3065941 RepID=A0ABU7JME5_9NOCA|nr:EthD family reductase [Rhodococcus sp. CC-R104]MEE2030644.1 EthD family reductase [Rhodococcus sp. CC-R104]